MLSILKKIFFAPVRAYPTTQPISYQLNSDIFSKISGIKPFSSIMYLVDDWRSQVTHLDTNERIIELPFVFNQLDFNKKGQVLDIGCCESFVSINLATAGFQVTGMDIRDYPLQHPNLKFIKDDICQTKIKTKFDYVISLSTLEHIGLDTIYGQSDQRTDDKKAIDKAHSLLKKNGKLILTLPASRKDWQTSFMRMYSPKKLEQYLDKFAKVNIRYFAPDKKRNYWIEIKASDLPGQPNFGVALVVATK